MAHKIPEHYQGLDVAYCGKCKQWKSKVDFHKDAKKTSGVSGHCKVCKKEWYTANSEHLVQKAMEWQRNNPERTVASIRKWEKNNPDKVKTYRQNSNKKQWQRIKNNPELLKSDRARKSKFVKGLEYSPEKNRSKHHKRRTRIYKSEGFHTPAEWGALCVQYGNICLCCKEKKPLTLDHIIPLSRGGSNSIDNLQPLCHQCNSRKGSRTIDYRPS